MRVATLLGLVALVGASAEAQSSAEAAVRRVDSLWAQMYAKQDTLLALAIYADNLVFTSANGNKKTRQQELNDVRPQAGLAMDFFRTSVRQVEVVGDSAAVFGVAEWQFTWNGSRQAVKRVYGLAFLRGGPHGWRIVAVRMGPPPPTD